MPRASGSRASTSSRRRHASDGAQTTGEPLVVEDLPFPEPADAEGTVADERYGFRLPSGYPPLQAAPLLCAPVGELVPVALRAIDKRGIVVCAGIHMSDIPSFPYELLWNERPLRSVANLTRRHGEEFLELAPHVPVRTHVETLRLPRPTKRSIACAGRIRGAPSFSLAED